MICNVSYPNFEAIPEFARNDFEQQADGTWKMKQDAIGGGAAEHFNAGLAANRDRALQQKQAADQARDQALQRAQNAETQLANLTQNGGRVFSAADAAAFDEYRKLGDVKTLQTTVQTAQSTATELAALKGEKGTKEIAEKTGLNFQPLNDWLNKPEAGVTYEPFTRDMEREVEENQNGQIVKVKKTVPVAFLKKTVDAGGVKTQSEVELLVEAKEKMPEYMFSAITAKTTTDASGAQNNDAANGQNQTFGQPPATQGAPPSFALPVLGSQNTQTQTGGGGQQNLTPAAAFQAERDAKPNPFAAKK